MEKSLRSEVRRTKLNKAIVATLAVSGVISVGLVAPGVLQVLGKSGLLTPQKKQNIKKSFSKLVGRGYITLDGGKARLTLKGEKFAALLGEGKLTPKKPNRWDKKWRVLIFDIPERRRATRGLIRRTLTQLGFYRLQDSVWIFPYDCEDLIVLLKMDLKVGKDVLYMIVDRLEYDQKVRAHFGLES